MTDKTHVCDDRCKPGHDRNFNTVLALCGGICLLATGLANANAPLVYYNFDNTVADQSGNNNNGSIVGSISYSAGSSGGSADRSINFDGSTYLEMPFDLIRGNPNFTISVDFKTTANDMALMGYQNTGATTVPSNFIPLIAINSSGQVVTELWTTSSTSVTQTSTERVDDGLWHRVVMTANTTDGLLSTYLDGTEVGTPASLNVAHLDMSFNFIGYAYATGRFANDYYTGEIDEFTFYNDALTAAEISKTPQAIDFVSIDTQLFSDATYTLSATASSGLPVAFSSDTTGVCTTSGDVVTFVSGGSCSIVASQSGDSTYSAAPNLTKSFFIFNDPDGDGVPDTIDSTPNAYGAVDTDGDGVPDYLDVGGQGYVAGVYVDVNGDVLDTDGDGVSDYIEAYPGNNDAPVFNDAGRLSSINFTPTQYATVNNATLDLTGDKVTVAAWINPDNINNGEIFVKNTDGLVSANVDYALRYRTDGSVTFHVGDGTNFFYCRSDELLGVGRWRYLVGTYEQGVGMNLYFDGVEQAVTCASGGSGSALSFGTSGTINFARYPFSGDSGGGRQYFEGSLDEFAVWDDVLTQAEVTSLFNNGDYVPTLMSDTGNYTSSDTLEGYWRFTDEGNNTLSDATGNGNTATLVGTPEFVIRRMEVSIVEGFSAVGQFLATDLDGQTLTYSVTGTDNAFLSIDAGGNLTFAAAPDFSAPGDDGSNNGYEVTLQATDGTLTATLPLLISVLSDTDGDGTADAEDAFPLNASESVDTDGDGVGDNADVFPNDPGESTDTDGDGTGDNSDTDRDGDGVPNDQDAFPDDATESADTDGDGTGDNSDTDRDGDGVPNDQDAFPDNATESADTDGDGTGDNSDTDRDGDGVPNDQDAFPDDATESADTDGDGVGNNTDAFPNDADESVDTDGDGVGDNADAFPNDANESVDSDGDGTGDNSDTDRDGDGVPNDQDAFPDDATESVDTDGDGVGDNADAFPNDADESVDTDGDGVGDNADAFPNDANESVDSDGDGTGDNSDTDRDGDGVPNDQDAFPDDANESVDTDGDGVGDNADAFPNDASESVDTDGDGVGDNTDAFPNNANESVDSDGDGTGDNSDTDRDGDGVPNDQDAYPDDATESADSDGDGVGNNADAFPNDASETVDTDGDGIGDNRDPDDDNDGIEDFKDQFPSDNTRAGDLDSDGIDDLNDEDRDGDGIANENDNDADGDGVTDPDANNTAPDAVGDVVDVDSTTPVSINVLINDTDINQDVLTVLSATTREGSVSVENNQVVYVAPENFTGRVIAKYVISDGNGGTDEGNILINISTFTDNSTAPLVLPPENVAVNATGLFTKVDLGLATATDSEGNTLPVSLVDGVTLFKPGNNTAYWEAIDDEGNRTVSAQEVLVRPLVSFSTDQTLKEGQPGSVKIVLNGEAPEYPMDISYAVSGSADSNDHSLRNDTITIESGLEMSIDFTTVDDGLGEGDETVELMFTGELNSVSDASHVITLIEGAIPPTLTMSARQQGQSRISVARDAGDVTVLATSNDNEQDTFTYVWNTNPALQDVDSSDRHFSFVPSSVATGAYTVTVTATSNTDVTRTVTETLDINVVDSLPTLSATQDTDNDGVPDSEEGFNDSDGDGISDYEDSITSPNVIPSLAAVEDRFLLEGEPGVRLRIGITGIVTDARAALLELANLAQSDNAYVNTGGVFDFEVRGLRTVGSNSRVVLPQQRPLPEDAVYRKYSQASGWSNFIEDANNTLSSTAGEIGYCPPPNADIWTPGLTEGHWCVRVDIEDGGVNDADAVANGTIVDPGGVAIVNSGNQLPVAVNDSASMLLNTSLSIDVLANDSDPDGDDLTITEATVNSTSFGSVTIENNRVIFTPTPNYFGAVTIDYAISDGGPIHSYASIDVEIRAPEPVDLGEATPESQQIQVRNSGGGALGVVMVLVLTLLVALRHGLVSPFRKASATVLVCLMVFQAQAQAQADTDNSPLDKLHQDARSGQGRLLLNIGLSAGSHSSSEEELLSSLNSAGATLSDYDSVSGGMSFGLLYEYGPLWVFSAGYRHAGELDNTWQLDTTTPQQDIQAVNRAMPTIGEGFYVGAGFRYSISKPLFAQALIEAQQWSQEISTVSAGFDRIDTKRSGVDPAITLGVGYRISNAMNVSLNVQRLQFDEDSSNNVSLQFDWKLRNMSRRKGLAAKSQDSDVQMSEQAQESPPVVDESPAIEIAAEHVSPEPEPEREQDIDAMNAGALEGQDALEAATSSGAAEPEMSAANAETMSSPREIDILFAFDKYALSIGDMQKIAKFMESYSPGDTAHVVGSADAIGVAVYNQHLAQQRVDTVKRHLLRMGVDADAIVTSTRVSDTINANDRSVTVKLAP